MREKVAKLQSLISTEDDRKILREQIFEQENLKMLVRIIRDEPEIWDKIIPQLPDIASAIFNYCTDTIIGKYGSTDAFDLVAIEILFRKNKQNRLFENLEKIILRMQLNTEAIDSFIYHVIKFLDNDEKIEILQTSRDIFEKRRSNITTAGGETRVKIGKALQWARFDRAMKAGREGSLKKAIVSLGDIYKEDPHKSGLKWWNTLMGTSLNADLGVWSTRYNWWKDELNSLLQKFVRNIETLQPVLSIIPSINPYLLTSSTPNFLNDLTGLDEKLHILCSSQC